uniref:Glycosyl transferase family 1 n=1 Tax=uncultured Bacteroidota bacterium TaxID=152509 RepID=H5SGL0_9BACT|nr:glycosyl transferase family 1 [uncultured Bacteroidetes bacterium]
MLTGPGSYVHILAASLKNLGQLDTLFHYYPTWRAEYVRKTREKTYRPYRWVVKGIWAVGRRLPYWHKFNPQRYYEYLLYDSLCALHLPEGVPVLWAWSQTSLFTMRKARRLGMKVLLELPASHPSLWQEVANRIYEPFPGLKTPYGLYLPAHLRRIEEELYEADHIQVLSSFVRNQLLERGFGAQKVHLLPLGVDAQRFVRADAPPSEPFRFLYVGRIELMKGVHWLLEAFRRLRLPSAELWLAGPILEEMRPILRAYEGSFVYKGEWQRERLPELYRQANVFVFPTVLDSFGLVLLEAMACGLPVIATSHSGAPDLIGPEEGWVVSPFSVEALMEAMESAYRTGRDVLWSMGKRARQKVEQNYTLSHYQSRVAAHLATYGV